MVNGTWTERLGETKSEVRPRACTHPFEDSGVSGQIHPVLEFRSLQALSSASVVETAVCTVGTICPIHTVLVILL
jgi:hypothetical protein